MNPKILEAFKKRMGSHTTAKDIILEIAAEMPVSPEEMQILLELEKETEIMSDSELIKTIKNDGVIKN